MSSSTTMMEVPYHYQFRIIVVGDTMAGKSSLLKTFSDGSFGSLEPTVGVDFFSKIIEIRPETSNHHGENDSLTSNRQRSKPSTPANSKQLDDTIIVKLQIWDTAGQERFKSIVTSYYRNSVGIILVYDVTNRESYDHLIDWLMEASRNVEPDLSPNSSSMPHDFPPRNTKFNFPLTSTPNASPRQKSKESFNSDNSSNRSFNSLVGNKSRINRENGRMAYLVLGCKTDLNGQRQVSYEDGQAFADQYGFKFIETSSKTLHNVSRAFELLAEEIYKVTDCGKMRNLKTNNPSFHTNMDGSYSQRNNEGIKLGPLMQNHSRHGGNSIRLLEAQPVTGFMGGCC